MKGTTGKDNGGNRRKVNERTGKHSEGRRREWKESEGKGRKRKDKEGKGRKRKEREGTTPFFLTYNPTSQQEKVAQNVFLPSILFATRQRQW